MVRKAKSTSDRHTSRSLAENPCLLEGDEVFVVVAEAPGGRPQSTGEVTAACEQRYQYDNITSHRVYALLEWLRRHGRVVKLHGTRDATRLEELEVEPQPKLAYWTLPPTDARS